MTAAFSFEGASHQRYHYVLLDISAPQNLPRMSRNFLFSRSGAEPEPIYIGEAESVHGAIINATEWADARLKYSATLFYFHPNFDPQKRKAEQVDLVARYDPPLNRSAKK